MSKILGIWIVMMAMQLAGLSQKIEQHLSFRDTGSESHFRFNYDNDYFGASDRNYTQGYSFELRSPGLAKNPINALLWKRKKDIQRYGVAIEHIGFSPRNIVSEEIQYGDRPFASSIFLKSFAMGTNASNTSRWTSSLSLGIIGPGAFGKEMQVAIHRATENKIPGGWHNQIKTDIVVNYEVAHEKQIVRLSDFLQVNSDVNVRLGTTSTRAGMGINGSIGLLPKQLLDERDPSAWRIYAYGRPFVDFVEYDATLQGGKFNKSSPYTIHYREVERIVGHFRYGIIVQKGALYFEYMRAMLSPEFKGGEAATYGGIKIGKTW